MTQTNFRFSVEELAFALAEVGADKLAAQLLATILADASDGDVDARLVSASHSLIARGHLDITQGTPFRIDKDLGEVLGVMAHEDYSVVCSRSKSLDSEALQFYVQDRTIIEFAIEKAVACYFRRVPSDSVIDDSRKFFSIVAETVFAQNESIGTLPAALLNLIQYNAPIPSEEDLMAFFESTDLPFDIKEELTQDILTPEYRGTVLKVRKQDGVPYSDEGFLILKGLSRCWLFEIVPQDPPLLKLYSGSSQYNALLAGLLK